MKHRIFILWVIGAALIVFGCGQEDDLVSPQLSTAGTLAKHQPANGYDFFFADFTVAPSAIANNGDKIDIGIGLVDVGGFGSFSFHPKTVSAGGPFTITSAAGEYTGTWTTTQLISFKSYGSTSPAPAGLPDPVWGGTLILEIELTGLIIDPETHKGILKLRCADFGTAPPGSVQGMTLQIAGGQHFTGVWPFPPGTPTAGATFFVELP